MAGAGYGRRRKLERASAHAELRRASRVPASQGEDRSRVCFRPANLIEVSSRESGTPDRDTRSLPRTRDECRVAVGIFTKQLGGTAYRGPVYSPTSLNTGGTAYRGPVYSPTSLKFHQERPAPRTAIRGPSHVRGMNVVSRLEYSPSNWEGPRTAVRYIRQPH
jgi:hypothetical protein